MIKCYKCGAEQKDGTKFCTKCGTSLVPKVKYYCPYCDNEILNKEAKFCNKCGNAFDDKHRLIEDCDDYSKYVCGKCGATLKSKREKFCKNCGNDLKDENKPLKWDDSNPLYRLCVHCGQVHNLLGYPVKCEKCGYELDLKPRQVPKLTESEQKIADEIAEKEKKQREEEERIKAEEEARIKAEAKKAEKKRRLEREKRIKKFKHIIKRVSIVLAVILVLLSAGAFIWHSFDDKNIAKAKELMATGDYNGAIKYYSYVMPLSRAKKECNIKIENIKAAAEKYESALSYYEKYEYLKAVQLSKEAIREYKDFKVADDLFDKAINDLGRYLKKIYDDKKYTEIYNIVNTIYEPYRTEQINAVYKSVVNMYFENCRTAQKHYDNGSPDEAIKYANAALTIIPNDKWAKSIVTSSNQYKNYVTDLTNGANAYNKGDWKTARKYYDMVPNDEVGKKAMDKFPSFISKIEEDIEYILNPVDISDKYGLGHYSIFHSDDYVDLSFTLKNRTNRNVTVRIAFEFDDYKTEYSTYYLSPKESARFTYSMYDVYISGNSDWSYSIVINNTEY